MHKKIFRSSFLTVFLVLIATIALLIGSLFHFFEGQLQRELKNEAEFLSQAVEKNGLAFFNGFHSSNNRVTLVDKDGTVLFDSKVDAASLDNHKERKEIKEAMKTGSGISVRQSETLTEKTVNYAVRLSDRRVLRISVNQYTVVSILLELLHPFLWILAAAFALTLFLSSRVSKTIIKPMNALDLEWPENNDTYEELTPLLKKISEQKQTIAAQLADAKKKQNEFRLITENMSEGFFVIDQEENLLTYNSAALDLLGIASPADGNVLTFCRTRSFREVITKALSGTKAESVMTQEEHSYSLIANPVFEGDLVIGAVVVILDITEREKRETLRREFTANVSHELKTPLTSISGFAELMKAGDVPPETVVDFSESIYNEARRLVALVNDIIKLSELDGKQVPFQQEPVDLYQLSEETIHHLGSEARKKGVSLRVTGESAKVIGVRGILDEMIYNLCDNAIKYNRKNGTVEIVVKEDENSVILAVRDTGIGIPAAHQSRVFERFYRVDKSHSRKVGGTGLGLAIVKHGAIYHNAKIRLKSTEGEGTVITVYFDKKQ